MIINQKQRPLVIIHGWSDHSKSFLRLAKSVEDRLQRKSQLINLADYLTMDDAVTFDDIAMAMERAFQNEGLSKTPHAVDVIVHSTGGLVIRHWLHAFYTPETAPIKHLLMLAPANFGSPLAHKGRAFYGRIAKGLKGKRLFNVGEKLLKGLELASPYTFDLALKDRFNKKSFYGPNKILLTVLIGNKGYSGIAAAANEVGSDGTVRIACANLNCALLDIDFSNDPLKPASRLQQSSGMVAFSVVDLENHSTIVAKDKGYRNPKTLDFICDALTIKDDAFKAWCKKLNDFGDQKNKSFVGNGFQNTVLKVEDQFTHGIRDYFIEFYGAGRNQNKIAETIHQNLIKTVHAYQANSAYRSIYINSLGLHELLERHDEDIIVNLTAYPEIRQNADVGYRTVSDKDIGGLKLKRLEAKKIFSSNRTLLVRIKLKREQSPRVFEIKKMAID